MSVVDVVHVLQIYENGELGIDENMYEILRLMRCKKKKKNIRQRENNHTQDSIYVIR